MQAVAGLIAAEAVRGPRGAQSRLRDDEAPS